MTKVIIAQIVKRFPGARFAIFSNDTAYDALWAPANAPITFFPTPSLAPDMLVKLYQLIRKAASRAKSSPAGSRAPFVWAQAIISIGGDVFSSDYGGLKRHLVPIQIATRLGKPTILLGHSIGPFKTEEEREIFIRTMQRVSLITVRETLSLKYVREMNLKNTRVELTADPAFCLPAADSETVDRIWQAYHLPHDHPVIGIAPSQGITYYTKTSYEAHIEALKELVHYITSEMGFHVVLIPHVHERYVSNDDRLICNRIYRDLGFPRDVSVITMDHSAEEIKGIIGRCSLLIAERMHAAIAGLSQSVPTLVVGYSVKARGILRDTLGTEVAEKCLIPIDKVNGQVLKERVTQLWDQRDTISLRLTQVMPVVKDRARHNFDLVQEILGE